MKTNTKCTYYGTFGKRMTDAEYLSEIIYVFSEGGRQELRLNEIVKVEGGTDLSTFFMSDGKRISSKYPLPHFAAKLPAGRFGRYCEKFIINLEYVEDYTTGSDWAAILVNRKLKVVTKEYIPINRLCRDSFKADFYK